MSQTNEKPSGMGSHLYFHYISAPTERRHNNALPYQVPTFCLGCENSPAESNSLYFLVLCLIVPVLCRPSLCGCLTTCSPF